MCQALSPLMALAHSRRVKLAPVAKPSAKPSAKRSTSMNV